MFLLGMLFGVVCVLIIQALHDIDEEEDDADLFL